MRRQAGFAVMELLIAMALLSVIASFIAGSLAFGNRVWERTNAISDNGQRLSEIAFIRDSLSQALIFPRTSNSQTAFNGQPDGFSLIVLRSAPGYAADQPWRITFAHIPRTDFITVGLTPDFPGPANTSERKLLKGLDAISVRYHGRLLDQDRARWQDEWSDQPHLPERIEISLSFKAGAKGEPAQNTTVIVRPKVQ
ncbi:type II secretion system protein GspJ [Breoghania sp.]|uniref:type II secretion system protein GspJ n=1 Tax=Breoghania sp. TaxID=2065378 RepID=UPI002AA91D91|nr:prepilin-type N-terminal cleavage/methylation domain-containing protein [Breoghania sp.]